MMGFGRTKSVCPVCLRVLEAQKTVGEHGIYLNKTCPEHGAFSALIWEGSIKEYFMWNGESSAIDPPVNGKEPQRGCPNDCGLCSAHLRKGCCVLLELTRRCNLECPVCYASAGKCGDDPNIEDIERQYDFLMAHGGPFNIQLSGGEPTLREDLPEIIWLGRQKGFTFFQLNTNGIRLAAEPDYAKSLKAAGLNTVFLQFDGMSDAVYEALRGRPLLREKLAAIESCAAAGLGIVLVPVIAPGVNEEEAGGILRLAMTRMPYGAGGAFSAVELFRSLRPEKGGKACHHTPHAAAHRETDGGNDEVRRFLRRWCGKPILLLPRKLYAPRGRLAAAAGQARRLLLRHLGRFQKLRRRTVELGGVGYGSRAEKKRGGDRLA